LKLFIDARWGKATLKLFIDARWEKAGHSERIMKHNFL
jgi:hypothetical protein